MNQIEFELNPRIAQIKFVLLKFHFDNGLTLRAAFYQDKTHVRIERAGKELRNCECICYTAEAFADTLHEYSSMTQKKAKKIVMPPNIGPVWQRI